MVFSNKRDYPLPILRTFRHIPDPSANFRLMFRSRGNGPEQRQCNLLFKNIHPERLADRVGPAVIEDVVLNLKSITEAYGVVPHSFPAYA